MSTTILTFIIAILFVALMVLGLSITLIRKGRDLQSDVGSNDEMKKRGIKCASKEMLEEERALRGEDICTDSISCLGVCDTCESTDEKKA